MSFTINFNLIKFTLFVPELFLIKSVANEKRTRLLPSRKITTVKSFMVKAPDF
jgi:hypothetical protein